MVPVAFGAVPVTPCGRPPPTGAMGPCGDGVVPVVIGGAPLGSVCTGGVAGGAMLLISVRVPLPFGASIALSVISVRGVPSLEAVTSVRAAPDWAGDAPDKLDSERPEADESPYSRPPVGCGTSTLSGLGGGGGCWPARVLSDTA
ncbi:hypothetical protein C6N75_25710 [Streptomyces solincola]|uniref:Uncharacterized protein n=1 Tax=Streptomyces solincola TaxID=2100817 RepID=A0A2S9PPT8_9ACTN|nr:hypothetical protein C6N75_25710 [Streptomyces solincola]